MLLPLLVFASIFQTPVHVSARRLPQNPIISPATDPSIGANINGPTLIKVPSWVKEPLGRYYLYFADHNGKYIRLAYADKVEGPWKIHVPGALRLEDSFFTDHIASPDAIIDEEHKQIRLYYHGLTPDDRAQHTRVATSTDGRRFTAFKEPVGNASAYWRVFKVGEWWYSLAMPGRLFRSRDGLTPFEKGPQLFPASPTQIHNAVLMKDGHMWVFFTQAGDTPEHIRCSAVSIQGEWRDWKPSASQDVLSPVEPWEGADLPIKAATIGAVNVRIHALRDPTIFVEGDKTYLLYAIAGESGIAIAELTIK